MQSNITSPLQEQSSSNNGGGNGIGNGKKGPGPRNRAVLLGVIGVIALLVVLVVVVIILIGNSNKTSNLVGSNSSASTSNSNGSNPSSGTGGVPITAKGGLLVGSGAGAGTGNTQNSGGSSNTTNSGPVVVNGKRGETLTKGDYLIKIGQIYVVPESEMPGTAKVLTPDLAYLAVEVTIKNNATNNPSGILSSKGTRDGVSSTGQMRLKTADGNYLEGSGGGFKTPQLIIKDNIPVGQTLEGWITFDMPKGTDPATLIYEYKVPSGYYDTNKLDITFNVPLK